MRFAQPETTAAMRWADSSPAATVCSMTDFLLHVALTVFMISSRCACVWLLGCVLRRGLLQDEEGVLSGIGLTSVDECLSVVDPPLSWKWMCSGDAAWSRFPLPGQDRFVSAAVCFIELDVCALAGVSARLLAPALHTSDGVGNSC